MIPIAEMPFAWSGIHVFENNAAVRRVLPDIDCRLAGSSRIPSRDGAGEPAPADRHNNHGKAILGERQFNL
jgi:hypothetical protein